MRSIKDELKLSIVTRGILTASSIVSLVLAVICMLYPASGPPDVNCIVFFMLTITLALLAWGIDVENENDHKGNP